MSFEGYYQVLCKNGHYETHCCYTIDTECFECEKCGEGVRWWNLVDLTNGSYDEDGTRIDGYIHLEEYSSCSYVCRTCSSVVYSNPPIYKIPTDKGYLVHESST